MYGSVVSTVPSSDSFVFRVLGSRCGFGAGLLWLEEGSNLSYLQVFIGFFTLLVCSTGLSLFHSCVRKCSPLRLVPVLDGVFVVISYFQRQWLVWMMSFDMHKIQRRSSDFIRHGPEFLLLTHTVYPTVNKES